MTVVAAVTAGFCSGVKNAVETALRMLTEAGEKYSLGEVIHNPQITEILLEKGLRVANTVAEVPDGSCLLIRAHGAPPEVYAEVRNRNLRLFDATCPYVGNIHRLIQGKHLKEEGILIFGSPEHPEVMGINGYCGYTATIIRNSLDAMRFIPEDKPYCLISQTTMIPEEYEMVGEILKKRIANLGKFDTICTATRKRQAEAVELAKKADLMLVVGGNNSSNTQKLFKVCKSHCMNTLLITAIGDLSPIAVNRGMTIGITAGASTPDWVVKEVKEGMEEKEKQGEVFDFKKAYEETLVEVQNGHVVKCRIIRIQDNAVYVSLGSKHDGTVPLSDFPVDSEGNREVRVDDEIEAMVIRTDSEGMIQLSKKRVDDRIKSEKIKNLLETGDPVKVTVKEAVSGGLIVDVLGLDGFIPASQLSDRYVRNLDKYVGRKIKARVIEHNIRRRKLILSRRVLLEEENERIEREVWSQMEMGKKLTGRVKSFTNFGAFVDMGGIDGLIHITELSWSKIHHPSEVLEIGQEIEVTVKDFDKAEKRISLGYKKEEDNIWYQADQKYAAGTVVTGTVVRILPFGAFVQIRPGMDALVHISQISSRRINTPHDVLQEGMQVDMAILDVDMKNFKINASIKAVKPYDPVHSGEDLQPKEREWKREEKRPSRSREREPRKDQDELPSSHTEDFSNTIGDLFGKIEIKDTEQKKT